MTEERKKHWGQVKKKFDVEICERDTVPPIKKRGKDGRRERQKLVKGTRKEREREEKKEEWMAREWERSGENYKGKM
jgi:hypothetical protein